MTAMQTRLTAEEVVAEAPAEAIRLERVSKRFQSKDSSVEALSRIDLAIPSGRFVAVVGASGCGKSTLLRLVAGLLPASEGEVRVRGRAVHGPDPAIGIVFQTPVLLPWRNVTRNIEIQLDIRGVKRGAARADTEALIRLVGLEGFGRRM